MADGSEGGYTPPERRASTGRGRAAKAAKPRGGSLVATPAGFKQSLLKYCRRQARQGRNFCVASLDILEYDQVRRDLGEPAAEQLNRLARDTCLRHLRDADRLCIPSPGRLLLLLPDADREGARRAVERIAQILASARAHHHHQALRASCAYRLSCSDEAGSNAETLLREVGFDLGGKGEIVDVTRPPADGGDAGRDDGRLAFFGEFGSWSDRYAGAVEMSEGESGPHLCMSILRAVDTWAEDRPVRIRKVEPQPQLPRFDATTVQALSRRARVLQSVDHPGLTRIRDYHVEDCRALYLVDRFPDEPDLDDYERRAKPGLLEVLEWGLQMCNSLIYLQSLMPPVVPPALHRGSFLVTAAGELILKDYEIPYLFPQLFEPSQVSEEDIQAASQGRPVPAYAPVIKSLGGLLRGLLPDERECPQEIANLLDALSGEPLPDSFNTVFKLRSRLKDLTEAERLAVAAGG